jgi:hypothetical protein
MPQKEVTALLILFIVLMSLSVAGVFDKISPSYNQTTQPKTTYTPAPAISNTPLVRSTASPNPRQIQTKLSPIRIPSFYSREEPQTDQPSLPQTASDSELTIQKLLAPGVNGIPFGGRVTGIESCDPYNPPCFCGGAEELITVGSPRGGTFAKNMNTRIYDFDDWSVGNWVLGLAHFYDDTCFVQIIGPEGECLYCLSIGSGPEINIMGTSK